CTHYILNPSFSFTFFFLTAPATPEIYTLSLHDALPIYLRHGGEIGAGLHSRHARCSEQSRRKAVTQSHGATAGQSATLAGPPAIHTTGRPRRPGPFSPRRGVP